MPKLKLKRSKKELRDMLNIKNKGKRKEFKDSGKKQHKRKRKGKLELMQKMNYDKFVKFGMHGGEI